MNEAYCPCKVVRSLSVQEGETNQSFMLGDTNMGAMSGDINWLLQTKDSGWCVECSFIVRLAGNDR